jgi:predicted transcriptional regulator of viral defense system
MARPSRLTLAKDDILALFSKNPKKVYSKMQLTELLAEHRSSWHLTRSTNPSDFIAFLTKHGALRTRRLQSKEYGQEIIRYSWGEPSPYELALSIKPRAYLCHATALSLHGLLTGSSKKIYINVEQSPKPSQAGLLSQNGIDLAFSRQQRQSKLVYTHSGTSITVIAGKNTNGLGVEPISSNGSLPHPTTGVERTLIDIVVRPAYAGGITNVLEAYRIAKNRISIEKLLATLAKLNHQYPYHQAIGFLMQTSEYPAEAYEPLRAKGLKHDFYLTHDIKHKKYSKDWRIYYPKEIDGL